MAPAIGAALAARGFAHVVFAQRGDASRALAAVRGARGAASSLHLDVSSRARVAAFFAAFTAAHARLDALVNCAGECPRTPLDGVREAELAAVFAVNGAGPLWTAQAARALLWASGGGAIVGIGSLAGEDGANAASVAYTMAKAAARGMMMQLAKEGFPPGTPPAARAAAPLVRVNNVAPGPVRTPMLDSMDAERLAAITAATLTGRVTAAQEVAAAVAFLVVDAQNVTGQTLQLSGGVIRR